MFARIFNGEVVGQICVMRGNDMDNKPQIQFHFESANAGVCMFTINYADDQNGYDRQEEVFETITLDQAEAMVLKTSKKLGLEF